jgi:ABC-type phosphate transport system substrate-binding protein
VWIKPTTIGQLVSFRGGRKLSSAVYSKWFKAIAARTTTFRLAINPSEAAGVKSFVDKTVDFASDAAMKPEEMTKVEAGVQPLPMTAGASC